MKSTEQFSKLYHVHKVNNSGEQIPDRLYQCPLNGIRPSQVAIINSSVAPPLELPPP